MKLVPSSPGPMARDVDSLALSMQALLCDHMFTLDPTVPPIPFNKQVCQQQNKNKKFSVLRVVFSHRRYQSSHLNRSQKAMSVPYFSVLLRGIVPAYIYNSSPVY